MTAIPSTRFTSITRPIVRSVTPLAEVPAQLGHITTFIIDTVAGIRHVATTYRRQTLLYIHEFAWDEALFWSAGVPQSCWSFSEWLSGHLSSIFHPVPIPA
ncbi:hypothetical protein SAMN04488550_4496 [Gordonia malaquae]|uniref:hypothetical protein n=1 Tax=Gordonia malaquae TaxID=410332 RepID=UPI00089666D7|nr:hypothetical protein [Gordonia malaquae]SEE41034.1 hypothetical protein SAMN04488550_4496 [Gordonia malaquae]